MPKRTDINKILIIGSGPIIIGQACEFDYSGTQACKALRKLGYEIVLVNSNPATIMTDAEIADKVYIENCRDILENGFYDTDLDVRPRWDDGTPAHTVKKFCITNRYDLREEFPIMTLRKTGVKNCIDEILWIWQKNLLPI